LNAGSKNSAKLHPSKIQHPSSKILFPIAIAFAALFLALTIWRELVWFRRFSTWERALGHVKSFPTEGDGMGPIIAYSVEGREKTFESSFCLWNPKPSAEIPVLFDPLSNRAVILTRRHRWFLTGLCGIVFLGMLGVAALSP
jgi:hypothetical protein